MLFFFWEQTLFWIFLCLTMLFLVATGNLDSGLWNMWIRGLIYKTLRVKVSSIASEASVASPMKISVHIHRRHGKGWDLIQDVTHITGNIHETFFIHQDEGVFLEEKKPTEHIV